MTTFLLNERMVTSMAPGGTVLLDILREHERLTGTKTGCREGDCGACTVLIGERTGERVRYRSMTSCLLALANVHGCHVVTVDALGQPGSLSPVQQAMVEANGTQCGFCTPGFVVSLTGFVASGAPATPTEALRAIDGNLCRCTGHLPIRSAALAVAGMLAERGTSDPVDWAVSRGLLPKWFAEAGARLAAIAPHVPPAGSHLVGGGTDLYVQRPGEMATAAILPTLPDRSRRQITEEGGDIALGGACVATDLLESELLRRALPGLESYLMRVASTPIRNMGTVAGNFINASPIGDLTAMFLALGASITLVGPAGTRRLPLQQLYLGYKRLALDPAEQVADIRFPRPRATTRFHFEKVSKRERLDIASVNTAVRFETDGVRIDSATFSAGGVAPIPLVLSAAGAALAGRTVDVAAVRAACAAAQQEIAPISDVRGSAEYKRRLLERLMMAHFLTLFPDRLDAGDLL